MSFIIPGGELWIFKGVPLDNNYENVFRFASGTTSSYIATLYTATWSNTHFPSDSSPGLSYQRVDNQTFKVSGPAWDFYDANYLIFHNSGNSGSTYDYGRYFFGFITDVLYINDNCTQFTYEIDWLSTWLSYCEFEDCFIERCTPDSDQVGDNIIPENIHVGEYVHGVRTQLVPDDNILYINYNTPAGLHNRYAVNISNAGITHLSELETVILVCEVGEDGTAIEAVDGSMIENTYSGATFYFTLNAGQADIDDFLENYKQHPNSIVAMYRIPKFVSAALFYSEETTCESTDATGVYKLKITENLGGISFIHSETDKNTSEGTGRFGNYFPENKKLYTYPYNYITVDNGCGEHMDLRYEFFLQDSENDDKSIPPKFYIEMSALSPVQSRVMPMSYGYDTRANDDNSYTFDNQLVLAQYPDCSWNSDYYVSWLAQNSVPIETKSIAGAFNGVVGLLSGVATGALLGGPLGAALGAAGALASNFSQVTDMMNDIYKASVHEDTYYGNLSAGNLNNAHFESDFHIQRMHITEQECRCIDNYFSAYGYAYKKINNPYNIINGNGKKYCYIKTTGCQAGGKIPSEAREHIEAIFNKGVRLWDWLDTSGNLGDIRAASSGNNGTHSW